MILYPSLNPKGDYVHTLHSTLLVPLYFHFASSRAGLLMPIILYVYVYIYFSRLDGYDGVGFAQGPASVSWSYAVIGPSVWWFHATLG